ncbi:MAG: hypothetical protein AAB074_19865 [Planctomycetota bacterium]
MRLFACALALIAALCGCSIGPGPEDLDKSRPEDKFDVTRAGAAFLDGAVLVSRMVVPGKDEPGGYYEAEFENKGPSTLSLEFRTIWKDSSDNALGAGEWQAVEIPAGRRKTVSDETEAWPDARFVKLEVRARP